MEKPILKIIPGGRSQDSPGSRKVFKYACGTDTRLMGVVCVDACWSLPENKTLNELHQLFYFDAEENGFDSYESVLVPDEPTASGDPGLARLRARGMELFSQEAGHMIGGLGASSVELSEKELRAMVQFYRRMTLDCDLELPEGEAEWSFLLSPAVPMKGMLETELTKKLCAPITSDYQLINYFIMRCAGHDFMPARLLTSGFVPVNLFPEFKPSTLIRNVITPGNNPGEYMCESLIDDDTDFFILISRVGTEDLRVVSYDRINAFRVSETEAAMMAGHSEFIDSFKFSENEFAPVTFETPLTRSATYNAYENGALYMVYKPDNSHVSNRIFRLDDDLIGAYFATCSGELLVMSFDPERILTLEADALSARGEPYLELVGKYRFSNPILNTFIESGYDSLEEFLQDAGFTPERD